MRAVGELQKREGTLVFVVAGRNWQLSGGKTKELAGLDEPNGRFRIEGVFEQREDAPLLAPKSWQRID